MGDYNELGLDRLIYFILARTKSASMNGLEAILSNFANSSPKAQVRSTAKCSEAWFSGLLEEWSPDLIPFWTLAVANVYQKWKQGETAGHQIKVQTLA